MTGMYVFRAETCCYLWWYPQMSTY